MISRFSTSLLVGFMLSACVSLAYSQEYNVHSDSNDLAAINRFIDRLERDPEAIASDGQKQIDLAAAYYQRFSILADQADAYRALDIYKSLSKMGLKKNLVLHSDRISEVYRKLEDKAGGESYFSDLLQHEHSLSTSEKYKAFVDYADLLDHFDDAAAGRYLKDAAALRDYSPGEAFYKWMRYLVKSGNAALAEQKIRELDILYLQRDLTLLQILRDSLIKQGKSIDDVDKEIEAIKDGFSKGLGGGTDPSASTQENQGVSIFQRLSLIGVAHAQQKYYHTINSDDCRVGTIDAGITTSLGNTGKFLINLAEILYNEARGESKGARVTTGWTVRNRVFYNLRLVSGGYCDTYVGAKGWANLGSCQSGVSSFHNWHPTMSDISERYCCAMHGGTTSVGSGHSQFNDAHVSLPVLEAGGYLVEAYEILNGGLPDLSSDYCPNSIYSIFDCNFPICVLDPLGTPASFWGGGSPYGTQEYLNYNYCAKVANGALADCKTYAKNVCGDFAIPANLQCGTTRYEGDNFFWNKK